MKAVVCRRSELAVADVPELVPATGQALLEVTRCGICGSDLHAREHADAQADVLAEAGYHGAMRSSQSVVLGHEFCGTVLDYGPGCRRKLQAGSTVVAMPILRTDGQMHAIGLSAAAPGAYAERVLVQESLMFAVPNGITPERAVLTEPMAIGLHAVRRADIDTNDVAIVIGCGPVGLAVISMLKAEGVRTVVASDPSAGRRDLARAMGADLAIDPREDSPYTAAGERGHIPSVPVLAAYGLDMMDKLRRGPLPWHVVVRVAERLGKTTPRRPVIFECVGTPGMLDAIISSVPLFSRVVVVGVCMVPDTVRPVMAINKEVDLRFVVGYSPLEFRDTLHLLAEGKVDPSPMVTATVGLDGVATAFEVLGRPQKHAKILIDPRNSVTASL